MSTPSGPTYFQVAEGRLSPITVGETPHPPVTEAQLRRWLVQTPDPIEPNLLLLGEHFACGRNVRREIDLLLLDARGHLVVVELKVEPVPWQARQAVEYAAFVYGMGLTEVCNARASAADISVEQATSEVRDFLERPGKPPTTIQPLPRIVLVAPGFDAGVEAAANFLARQRVDIRLIEYSLLPIADREVVRFQRWPAIVVAPRRRSGGPAQVRVNIAMSMLRENPQLKSAVAARRLGVHEGHARKILREAKRRLD